jgi:hypothetical protein
MCFLTSLGKPFLEGDVPLEDSIALIVIRAATEAYGKTTKRLQLTDIYLTKALHARGTLN